MSTQGQQYRDFPMPLALVDRARRWCADPSGQATPRLSASVLLVRDGDNCMRVFAGTRAKSMAFAGGVVAFPGGGSQPGEDDPRQTALRELTEETGVVLPSRSALRPVSRWVTPAFQPMRFDTHFYVAQAPAGAQPKLTSAEFDHAGWQDPAELLRAADQRRAVLMPPTRVLLEQLAKTSSARAMAASDERHPVCPWPVQINDRWFTRANVDERGQATAYSRESEQNRDG